MKLRCGAAGCTGANVLAQGGFQAGKEPIQSRGAARLRGDFLESRLNRAADRILFS
jgi:hypothetical protein